MWGLSSSLFMQFIPFLAGEYLIQLQSIFTSPAQTGSCAGALQLSWSNNWSLLGPFQLGTREAEWGSDPLQIPKYGGFLKLIPDNSSTFHSSLSRNGTVSWTSTKLDFTSTSPVSTIGTLIIEFNDGTTDWQFLRDIYGWSGIQFQAWSRGYLHICSSVKEGNQESEIPVAIQIDPMLEFYIDGKHYFGGDMYSYRRAPLILHLKPGKHQVDLRITHDIRAFGGGMPPKLDIRLEAKIIDRGLVVVPEGAVIADVLGGVLAGEWGSIPIRNSEKDSMEIISLGSTEQTANVSMARSLVLAPGQTRPLKFRISDFKNTTSLSLSVRFKSAKKTVSSLIVNVRLNHKPNLYLPHVFTFLHPSGIVSYGALRPPSEKVVCSSNLTNKIPILLTLHGAGVDVRWPATQSAYDNLPDLCTWILFPQGVTTWSGDDWHNWGFADVEAAIAAIPDWINQTKWRRQGVDLEKWVVSGHSNGGQGTWNDKIIAATPLSGYLSISAYVPYHTWHEIDPRMFAIVLTSLNSYKHELLVENFAGTPIYQLHGELDDNVPAFHSRRMALLAAESGHEIIYREVPGQRHWWEGVMTEASLPGFLKYHLENHHRLPRIPHKFSIVVPNPGDMGSRGGIHVDQLDSYEQVGRMYIDTANGGTWVCKSNNIRRFHLGATRPGTQLPANIVVDGQLFNVADISQGLFRTQDGYWKIEMNNTWRKAERHSSQLGVLDAFLKSAGAFRIILPKRGQRKEYHESVALDVSRSLYQYFAADSEIVDLPIDIDQPGNVILFDLPDEGFPIVKFGNGIRIETISGKMKTFAPEPGLGAIFIRPFLNDKLALVIWGSGEEGLRNAARLLPLRSGVGQPNFIVVGREGSWKGVAGVKAMGIYDSQWRIQSAVFSL